MMTYEQVIDRLVAASLARWPGEDAEASRRFYREQCPSIGLALNKLAHWDVDNIDQGLAEQASQLLTPADWRVLRQGG